MEIHDCRPKEQQWVGQVANVTMKAWQTSGAKYWQGSEAWAEIQHATDMTLDMLKQVDWVQVLTNVAKTVGVFTDCSSGNKRLGNTGGYSRYGDGGTGGRLKRSRYGIARF